MANYSSSRRQLRCYNIRKYLKKEQDARRKADRIDSLRLGKGICFMRVAEKTVKGFFLFAREQ